MGGNWNRDVRQLGMEIRCWTWNVYGTEMGIIPRLYKTVLFSFSFFPGMLYYSYTLMFSFILQHCCYSIVSFCSLLDDVCLSGNKRITYLLTYLTYVNERQ